MLFAAPAMAEPVTCNYSGVVTRVTWSLGGAVGDRISGAFSFDTEPVAGDGDDPFTAFSFTFASGLEALSRSTSDTCGHLTDGVENDGVQVFATP